MSSSLRLNPVNMSILEKIVTQTKMDLKKRISERSLQSLESEWGYEKEVRSFSQAIRGKEVNFITEVKKASPSKSAVKTGSGRSVSSNKFRSTSKKSLNNIKSTKFRSANRKASGGGFGNSRPQRKAVATQRRSSTRRRSLFGGGSRRMRGFGFGGFGRRRR